MKNLSYLGHIFTAILLVLAGGLYMRRASADEPRGESGTASARASADAQASEKSKKPPLADQTYKQMVFDEPFENVMQRDLDAKQEVTRKHAELLRRRYDLSDQPSQVQMSGKRKAVQEGVRVKLPDSVSWDDLAAMPPATIKQKGLFPMGFRPLPHPKHATGGQVYPATQIEAIADAEARDLERFDVSFDLPNHLTPEFPPPMFLTSRSDLGDVSQGELLTIKNYYRILKGVVSPVQMEGMRRLLTPFPQQEFNQTEDRKVKEASLGVACLDCHSNGHTNAAFHLTPDVRPQAARFRLDSVSLRGMYNQQIHGSKRSLRSVEDFSEFEQRTAYFDGDHVIGTKKGAHFVNRASGAAMMAQMQNMFDFPPAPKLDVFGKLIPEQATELEMKGQEVFFGKGRCVECHQPPFYLDNKMHDLHLDRFYEPEMIQGQYNIADGPIKTFTLRGIKDSPPYHHDGRLLTLEDTVEFFSLVTQVKLTDDEKQAVVAFMRCL